MAIVIALVATSSNGSNPSDRPTALAKPTTGSSAGDGPVSYGKRVDLPFAEFFSFALTADTSGNVYVGISGALLTVPPGAANSWSIRRPNASHRCVPARTTPTFLPFGPLGDPKGVAVGPRGSVYATDGVDSRVLRLGPGSDAPVVLPSPGILDLEYIAVDPDENVYVANRRKVVKLAKDFTTWEEVTGGPTFLGGIAVDTLGNLYVGGETVFRRTAPNGPWTRVGFTGLAAPTSVAVDEKRNVYVLDTYKRVVMLPVN